jgi:hypothetical protein
LRVDFMGYAGREEGILMKYQHKRGIIEEREP